MDFVEDTIELREILQILKNRRKLIVIITVLALLIATGFTMFGITPLYQSSTTLMVNSSKGILSGDLAASFDLGSINLSQKLVVTYSEIVKSRIVLDQVIRKLDLDISYGTLYEMTLAQQVKTTEILKISVSDTDPERASLIANTIAEVFVKEVIRILKADNVETIDRAIPNQAPINIKLGLNAAISLVLGLMLGVFIAFALEYLDHTIKTEEDVKKYLDLPVLGAIPDVDLNSPKKRGRNRL
ncbi:MAG: hypothetical protein JXQ26_05005 [Tissierellales bacterium]|nr:hypothetical protein [Tissierellales bacterium]MBN2827321.1 hypothetical protein [Tissierellales bacterium]